MSRITSQPSEVSECLVRTTTLTVPELSLKVSGWMKECVMCGVVWCWSGVVLVSVLFRVGVEGKEQLTPAGAGQAGRILGTLLQQQQL